MAVQDTIADDVVDVSSFASDIEATDYGDQTKGMGFKVVTAGTGTVVVVTAKGNERTLTGLTDGDVEPVEWVTIKSTTDVTLLRLYLQ